MGGRRIKVLAVNSANILSTGNIMLDIAEYMRSQGEEAYTVSKYTKQSVAAMRTKDDPNHFFIGNRFEHTLNRYISWYTDFQDVGSVAATYELIRLIEKKKPDVIHLHDIVGWYIQIDILMNYLKKSLLPVIWTMHDCWAYTGRCIYYDMIGCRQWMDGCRKCPQLDMYPYSKVFDRAAWNYARKKKLFTSLPNLTIVTPSAWLQKEVQQSFLKSYPVEVIYNGIDLSKFKPVESSIRSKYNIPEDATILLAVASAWNERKGLSDLIQLNEILYQEGYRLIVVGLTQSQCEGMPESIISITKTSNLDELVDIYSGADILVNPTKDEVLGLVNIEALACGTPVVMYNTGGAPECIDSDCGLAVEKGNLPMLISAIKEMKAKLNCSALKGACVSRASSFDKHSKYDEYYSLYKRVLDSL